MKTNELKCTDLRIGNWIKYEDKLVQVVQLSSLMILCQRDENQFLVNCEPKVFQPIELTEEVLAKIGFKKNIIYGNVIEYFPIDDNLTRIFCIKEKQNFKIQNVRKNITETIEKHIKYLHQLQNAYYLLTNEELEVKL